MKTKDECLKDAIRESARKCKRTISEEQIERVFRKWERLVKSGLPEDHAFAMATRTFRHS